MTMASAAAHLTPGAPAPRAEATPARWRKPLVVMTAMPFALHNSVAIAAWAMDSLRGDVVWHYLLTTMALLALFAAVEQRRRQWGWTRAQMSANQIMVSILPCAYVLYWMDSVGARAAMVMVALASTSFGVISLNTRRTLGVAAAYALTYLGVLLAVQAARPQVMQWPGDLLMFLAFVASVTQMAVMGGYLFSLRAKLAAKSAELAASTAQLTQLAMRDELTQVLNRRSLLREMSEALERAAQAGTPLSLALIDLDHFKTINDTLGHQAGDAVLQRVAQAIAALAPGGASFGRYGGEEFLLVLPHTELDAARASAEAVRHCVSNLAFDAALARVRATVSIGVAQWQPGSTPALWVAAADAALYRAKASGRNQVQAAKAMALQPAGANQSTTDSGH